MAKKLKQKKRKKGVEDGKKEEVQVKSCFGNYNAY